MNKAYKNYIESLDTIKLEAELDRQYASSSDCARPEGMRYRASLRYRACELLLGWKEHDTESAKRLYLSFWKRYLPLESIIIL